MARNSREVSVMIFFLNEMEHFDRGEVGVRCGFLMPGGHNNDGWQNILVKDEDDEERSVLEVRTINIFTPHHIFELIEENSHIFEGSDLSLAGILSDAETNANLACLLSGEALGRFLQSEVLLENL